MSTAPVTPEAPPKKDPWIDNDFGGVDFSRHREDLLDDLAAIANEDPAAYPGLSPEVIETPPEPVVAPVATPVQEPAAPGAEADEPQVIENADGSSIRIEKSSKGWKGVLDSGTGAPVEVFYGKTKTEMFTNIAVGKMNATKKIRSMTREMKLGNGKEQPARTPAQPNTPAVTALTADDIFEIKTELQSNPDLALDKWFQKKTGMDVATLVKLAKQGQSAKTDLDLETVARAFVSHNPGYYNHDSNYEALVAYLAKNKIGITLTKENQDEVFRKLVQEGEWTVENLEEAYVELQESGLLVQRPRQPEQPEPTPATPPVQPQAPPAPQPAPERIVRQETRPRAGLGIRTSETTPTRVLEPTPPSAEDLDSLSDEEIAKLLNATRQQQMSGRRRP